MSTLKLINVNKTYQNNVQAVKDFNLDVKEGEFIVLVGPSGCGKSTTLRMIAGLEEITEGEIYIGDTLVNDVAPRDRDIAMVFQNYALYPHMTVYENMAFALKLRKLQVPELDEKGNQIFVVDTAQIKELEKENKYYQRHKKIENREQYIAENTAKIQQLKENPSIPVVSYKKYTKQEIDDKIQEASQILGLKDYLNRKPSQLSGGQKQRVALGRAIVRNPKVFLMDEPLSNLDAKLRAEMKTEILRVHQQVGATTFYVTHDQTEAMNMADRIVIMKDGYIQQIGSPKEIYETPKNKFVAGFIGSPAMNFLKGILTDEGFNFEGQTLKLNEEKINQLKGYIGKEIILGIRPENIYLNTDDKAPNKSNEIEIYCELSELLGNESVIYGNINENKVNIKTKASFEIKNRTTNSFVFDLNKVQFFDAKSEEAII